MDIKMFDEFILMLIMPSIKIYLIFLVVILVFSVLVEILNKIVR